MMEDVMPAVGSMNAMACLSTPIGAHHNDITSETGGESVYCETFAFITPSCSDYRIGE
jgi:hypothetical protein